jgi:gamma-glutamyltranspeptidase
MAAATHWLAAGVAQSVLERGGNAFDAAVAGGFVLHVVEPHLNGPGGDLVGILATADDPNPQVLMGQGPAPAGATIEHVRAEGLDLVPGAGALAAAIPGAVDAWLMLLRDHGTWELGDVLEFAIGYAEDGVPLGARVCSTIATVADLFTTPRASRRGPVSCTAFRRTPRRCDGWPRPGPAPPGRTGSTPLAARGARGSSPRPSRSSSLRRTATPPGPTTPEC